MCTVSFLQEKNNALLRSVLHILTLRLHLERRNFLISNLGGYDMVRNKEKGFPYENENKFQGERRAKDDYASKRADGSINQHPQERMRASGKR